MRLIKFRWENQTYNSKFAKSDIFEDKNVINTTDDFENKKNKKANDNV